MNRTQLAHALRAAADVVAQSQFVVIGSAAIFGAFDSRLVSDRLTMSVEADLIAPGDADGSAADAIDGAIGELSAFHRTHGFYVDGVGPATALLPSTWPGRVIAFAPEDANGVIGWCLHPTDLAASKALAGRPKDRDFVAGMVSDRLVVPAAIMTALRAVPDVAHDRLDIAVDFVTSLPPVASAFEPTPDVTALRHPLGKFSPEEFDFVLTD